MNTEDSPPESSRDRERAAGWMARRDALLGADAAKVEGKLLSDARSRSELTQDEVCDGIRGDGFRLNQGMLSEFENGRRLAGGELLGAIVGFYDDTALISALRRFYWSRAVLSPFDDSILLEGERELESRGGGVLWLFGPESAPVVSNEKVRARWARNLVAEPKVDYVLVWFLDLTDTAALYGMMDAQTEIVERISASGESARGRIRHYAAHLQPDSVDGSKQMNQTIDESVRIAAQELRKQCITLEIAHWTDLGPLSGSLRRTLLRYCQAFATIALFLPEAGKPHASIYLGSVRASLRGSELSTFLWLGDQIATDLRSVASTIANIHSEAKQQ